MNALGDYGSSSEEDNTPTISKQSNPVSKKKVKQIFVNEVKREPIHVSNVIHQTNGSLLTMLPSAKNPVTAPKALGSNNSGSMISIKGSLSRKKSSTKSSISDTKDVQTTEKRKLEEVDDEEFNFFTLPGDELKDLKSKPVVGPSKPTAFQENQVNSLPSIPIIMQQNKRMREDGVDKIGLQSIGHRTKHGPIQLTTVNQKDQLGDVHERHTARIISQEGSTEDAFANLEDKFYIGDSSRHNNIMALVHQAKARSKEMAEQKAERRAVRKIVRQKYGF